MGGKSRKKKKERGTSEVLLLIRMMNLSTFLKGFFYSVTHYISILVTQDKDGFEVCLD